MSNKVHCIAIMYHGSDIPENLQAVIMTEMMTVLVSHGICIPELTTIVYKDSEGLALSVAKDIFNAKDQVVPPVTENPVENALLYLKKRYEKELENSNLIPLVIKLAEDIRAHKTALANGKTGDILLMNSLEIVTTNQVTVLQLANAGISERALNQMEQCYRYV